MSDKQPECFVIMPISNPNPEKYKPDHFQRIYEDVFVPACEQAEFHPTLASRSPETNIIHLDILRRLVEAPMALCDLSALNPNVFFELGIRQAFDKPVVLVQEEGTPQIFDTGVIRTLDYRPNLDVREVPEDLAKIAEALTETFNSPADSVNSLVRLLELLPARLGSPDDEEGKRFELILNELQAIRSDLAKSRLRRAAELGPPLGLGGLSRSTPNLMDLLGNQQSLSSHDFGGKEDLAAGISALKRITSDGAEDSSDDGS
ncbi:MAG: hypothetical protein GY937_24010 [bacterium]|nr:hypothetical protein [bacterium]